MNKCLFLKTTTLGCGKKIIIWKKKKRTKVQDQINSSLDTVEERIDKSEEGQRESLRVWCREEEVAESSERWEEGTDPLFRDDGWAPAELMKNESPVQICPKQNKIPG